MQIGDVDAEVGDIWETFVEHPDGSTGRKNRILVLDIVEDRVGPLAWVYVTTKVFSGPREGFERFQSVNRFDLHPRKFLLLARV